MATRFQRHVRESQHESSEMMMPQHANVLGHVFGGVVLSMMDTTAAVSAIRHARLACVTVSVDRVDFREPIHVGELVVMKACGISLYRAAAPLVILAVIGSAMLIGLEEGVLAHAPSFLVTATSAQPPNS